MNSHKEIAIKLVSLVLLCVVVWGDAEVRCIEREREALASFKNGLKDESGILSSWRGGECCNWYGVVCSNTSTDDGHVIRLDLGSGDFDGVLGGKVSSSLLELHHLNYLDLSYNDFGGHPIPEFIASMKNLQYLSLRYSNFYGVIPPQLGNLTNLLTLDLSHNSLKSQNLNWLSNLSSLSHLDLSSNSLKSENLNWLSSLSFLSYLGLGGNDFGGHPIPEFIGSMKKLEHLYLRSCNFSGMIPPQLGNLTNLHTLDLSSNSLKSENLNWLSNLSSLSVLDLSDSLSLNDTNWLQQILNLHSLQELHLQSCNISDVNPSIVNSSCTSLSILDLSANRLTSSAFDWLSNLSSSLVKLDLSRNALGGLIPINALERLIHVEHLDLSSNMLEGEIPTSLGSLSHLRVLVLYDNELRGDLNESIGNLSSKGLEILDLARNQLTGSVPDLGPFLALTEVYLGRNKLRGTLPVSLGQLSKLQVLEVSHNSLEGAVSESHFIKLDNLNVLDLSFNSLSVQIASNWSPPFQLKSIFLAGCNVGSSFPKWIQTQRSLLTLDLSSAGIIDEVPSWLWSFSPLLEELFLSHNQISGTIPDLSSTSILSIDVTSNIFSGPIPSFHNKSVNIQLNQNMFFGSISSICEIPHDQLLFLGLSNNQLYGELPNCWEKIPNLLFLELANNSFSGEVPHSFGSLHDLHMLQLRDNNLSGELPSTLSFCRELELFDVGGNEFTGEIPSWIGEFHQILFLNLGSNRFHGSIPSAICNLTDIQILDIRMNNMSGKIPDCFNNFTKLANKNTSQTLYTFGFRYQPKYNPQLPNMFIKDYDAYSSVGWKGQESEYSSNLDLLKLIDFSSNRFTGNIPQSISSMKGLRSLNLSRNSLTGIIIPDIGEMEMLESLDLSENKLSGEIPTGLAQLHSLAFLDLSNNSLSGRIPSGTQLQSFNSSSYAGNNGLCGNPLTLCPEDIPRPPVTTEEEKTNEGDEGFWGLSFVQEFGISMGFGFIFGFWGVVGSFIVKRSWRIAFFKLLDAAGDWFYVKTALLLSKYNQGEAS